MKVRCHLSQFNLKGRRVLVRIDANVPLHENTIANDYRLEAALPTLKFIKDCGGTIILITHIGRPQGPTPTLSTKLLQPWLEQKGFTVTFAADVSTAYTESLEKKYTIILLENIRFFPGEKKRDLAFAQALARLGDYYVNDAFATLHRNDTSITLLAEQFTAACRTVGFLVEKELIKLSLLTTHPQRPFVALLGGGKPATKIPAIASLMHKADTIVVCPALIFTFTQALGKETGLSLVDKKLIPTAQSIIANKHSARAELVFPIDYQIAQNSINGQLTTVTENNFPKNGIGVGLGPKSLTHIETIILHAGTIFFNCAMGFPERPDTLQSSRTLLKAIAHASAYSVIAGGNSVDLAFQSGLAHSYSYISTGGGSTLDYISGQSLPGLKPFTA